MRNSVPSAVLPAAALLLAAATARAQEEPRPSLEETVSAVRPADLAGETWFGLYRHGKSVGTLQLTLAAQGDGLQARVVTAFTLEGVRLTLEEEARLASPLAPLRLRQVSREGESPPEEVVAAGAEAQLGRQADGLRVRALGVLPGREREVAVPGEEL